MIVTDGVRETFRKRSKVMSTIRQMLEQQGFLEIETPVLESTAGNCLSVCLSGLGKCCFMVSLVCPSRFC